MRGAKMMRLQNPPRRLSLTMAILVGWLVTGCASGPQPQALMDANTMLSTQESKDLESDKPRLMGEGRGYLAKANAAYDDGDMEAAELLAHAAMNRYRTARNLTDAGTARRMALVLKRRQRGEIDEPSDGVSPVNVTINTADEQARFDRLEGRIDRLNDQLTREQGDSPELLGAKRALAKARRKQSQAIGAEAPRLAAAPYREGASHTENAIEALELAIYSESKLSSEQAVGAFERAIQKAGKPKKPADAGGARDKAEKALTQAARARAGALGARAKETHPGVFQQGEALHGSAREAFDRDDYRGARRLALDAVRAYEESAAKGAARPSALMGGTSSAFGGMEIGSVLASPARIEALIVALRFKRAEMLGTGQNDTCPAVFKEFEAIVDLAHERYQAGDLAHAAELAIRAQERVRRCEAKWATPPKAEDKVTALERQRATKALQRAQAAFARALSTNADDPKVRQGEALIRNAVRWFDRGKPAQVRLTEGEQRAAKAIDRAQEAQLEALERVSDPRKLSKGDRYLELAERSFGDSKWWQATDQAGKALRHYQKLGATKPTKKPRKKPRNKAEACRQAPAVLRETARLARNTGGDHLSTDQARRHDQATALVRSARRRLDRKQCVKALTDANRASELLMDLPYRSDASPDERPDARPGAKPIAIDEPGQEGAWEEAYDAAQRALKARDRARRRLVPSMKGTYRRGVALLEASRDEYESAAYDEALSKAEAALAQFEAVMAGGEDGDEPAPLIDDDKPSKPQKPGRRAKPKADPWRAPYYVVYGALAMRDRAVAAAKTPDQEDAIERGNAQLRKARRAWEEDDWSEAAALAREAMAAFREVFDEGKTKDGDDPDKPPEPAKATYEQAEAAVREARVVLQVCERDQCDDRDSQAFTSAKETVASAEQNLEAKRYGYAVKLGEEARDELVGILAKPRKDRPAPTVDPEAKRAAEEAVRDAEIQRQLCEEKRDCKGVDLEAFLHAQKDLSAAGSALADGDVDRAKRLADKAGAAFGAIQATAPKFVIPAGIGSVTRSGDQLYLSPPIKFGSGQSQFKGSSQTVVQDLAAVLKQNLSQVSSVSIVGFTDNRGNAALNKNISGARAKSVRQALVSAGLPAGLLSSTGRGPDNPIADNGTPEGRAANRRVEVHFQQK